MFGLNCIQFLLFLNDHLRLGLGGLYCIQCCAGTGAPPRILLPSTHLVLSSSSSLSASILLEYHSDFDHIFFCIKCRNLRFCYGHILWDALKFATPLDVNEATLLSSYIATKYKGEIKRKFQLKLIKLTFGCKQHLI